MVSATLQILIFVSFLVLVVLVWRVSKRPKWRVRAVIYGWGASIVWAVFWAVLMPIWLQGMLDSNTLAATFPDGTIAAGFLVCGWFWPLVVVILSNYRKKSPEEGKK